MDLCFAAATDDVMLFGNGQAGTSSGAAKRLDAAMVEHGVVRNALKDVDDQLN